MQDIIIVERVFRARESEIAADELIQDYLPFIRSVAGKAGIFSEAEREDAQSVAMLGFYQAIQSYSRFRGPFLGFAELMIRRKLIDFSRMEKRHKGQLYLDAPLSADTEQTARDLLCDTDDRYSLMGRREATRQEMEELSLQLGKYGLRLSDVAENCPRQARTLSACRSVLEYIKKEDGGWISQILKSGRLPLAELSMATGVSRKTLERHRKYLFALLLIFSNGYELIREHLGQVFVVKREGAGI